MPLADYLTRNDRQDFAPYLSHNPFEDYDPLIEDGIPEDEYAPRWEDII